jgi:Fibronectin type III domain
LMYDKVGTCRVIATQAGNSRYLAADPSVISDVVINAANPDPITLTRVVPGASQLTATWSAASVSQMGGSTVKTYVISWAANADFSDENSATVSSTTYVITGLTPQTTYRVRVRVVSNADLNSNWSNVLTGIPFGLPNAPATVSAVVAGGSVSGIVQVNWSTVSSPNDGGTPITGYMVYSYKADTNELQPQTCNGSPTDNSCLVTGLSGSVNYYFKVSSINAVGSALSAKTNDAQPALTQTITVTTDSTLLNLNHGLAPFSIYDYASVDSGLPLTFSLVEHSTDVWSSRHVCTYDATSGLITIDVRGTCVFTVNQDGKDATGHDTAYKAADAKTFTITVSAIKPAETQATLVSSGDTTLGVNWTAPADDGGAPIIGYKVQWYRTSDAAPTDSVTSTTYPADATSGGIYKIENPGTSTYTLIGLTNGQRYYVYVHAYNVVGTEGL